MIAIPTLSLALAALVAPTQDAPAAPAGDQGQGLRPEHRSVDLLRARRRVLV